MWYSIRLLKKRRNNSKGFSVNNGLFCLRLKQTYFFKVRLEQKYCFKQAPEQIIGDWPLLVANSSLPHDYFGGSVEDNDIVAVVVARACRFVPLSCRVRAKDDDVAKYQDD